MITETQYRDRVLALAGTFQAVALVSQVARQGIVDSAPFTASINSVFVIDADNVEDVYGGVGNLTYGLTILRQHFGQSNELLDKEITRYLVGLVHLERRLVKNLQMLNTLREGIQAANAQFEIFHSTHSNIIARLADIYSNTISNLGPRIMVHGEPMHLNNPENANRIRALLLAGIRSAVLWRQKGGGRFNLLLSRKRIVRTAGTMLAGTQ